MERFARFAPATRGRVLLIVSIGLIIVVVFAIQVMRPDRSPETQPNLISTNNESVSRTTFDDELRCTARLTSSAVEVGDKVPLVVTITNLSDRTLSVPGGVSGMEILDPSGLTVFDSDEAEAGILGPPIGEERLEPGAMFEPLVRSVVRVEWPSYVVVKPTCPLFREPLGTLRLEVSTHGEAPEDSLGTALDRTHGLFRNCRPPSDGGWRTGVIRIPGANGDPPMAARCSASITEYGSFDVVELRIVSPPDAPKFEMPRYITVIPPLPGTHSFQAARWRFVVSSSGARQVDRLAGVHHTAPAPRMAPHYDFFGGRWHEGRSRCGGTGSGAGILIISACPP